MYCHKCGSPNQSTKAYCKSCGEWLPEINAKTRNTLVVNAAADCFHKSLYERVSTLAALFSAFALYITYLGSGDAKWSIYIAGASVCA